MQTLAYFIIYYHKVTSRLVVSFGGVKSYIWSFGYAGVQHP